jgi:hypothetical protein
MPLAKEATIFASSLGANRDSGGIIGDTVRDVLNGMPR